jgi:hypothetical protein
MRAKKNPESSVTIIATTIIAPVARPSAAISGNATRRPSSATAQRNTLRTQNAMPGRMTGWLEIGLSAMPITNASTMAGIGSAWAT